MRTNILVDRAFKMTDSIYHQISDFSLNMQVKKGNQVGRNCVFSVFDVLCLARLVLFLKRKASLYRQDKVVLDLCRLLFLSESYKWK